MKLLFFIWLALGATMQVIDSRDVEMGKRTISTSIEPDHPAAELQDMSLTKRASSTFIPLRYAGEIEARNPRRKKMSKSKGKAKGKGKGKGKGRGKGKGTKSKNKNRKKKSEAKRPKNNKKKTKGKGKGVKKPKMPKRKIPKCLGRVQVRIPVNRKGTKTRTRTGKKALGKGNRAVKRAYHDFLLGDAHTTSTGFQMVELKPTPL